MLERVQNTLVVLQRVVDRVNKVFVIVLLGSMVLLVSTSVFMRYFLDTGFHWCEDIVTLLFAYLIYFSIPLALRSGAHIRIKLVTIMLPEKIGKVLSVIVDFIVFFSFILLFQMCLEAIPVIGNSPYGAIKYPMSFFYYGVAASCILMFLDCFIIILNNFTKKEVEASC